MAETCPLVSIVTPCYNGEKWIARLITSVLHQTYSSIEFIAVNDGSTDRSEEIILSFQDAFLEKGYRFHYVYQENQGLGGAINTGMKHITGEYFCWPDADDYLEQNSVELRVRFLIEHPEYAVVTSNAYIRNAENLADCRIMIPKEAAEHRAEKQFEMLLDGRGIFCPGCHMMRVSALDSVNPDRSIYPARRGQNWQLLLPVYYRYKRFFLEEPLYNYIDHPGSMSKDAPTLESVLLRIKEHEEIILHTLEMIESVQKVSLSEEKARISYKYLCLRMDAARDYNDAELYRTQFRRKKEFGVTARERFIYWRMKNNAVNRLYCRILGYRAPGDEKTKEQESRNP